MMKTQNYEIKNQVIRDRFLEMKNKKPESFKNRLKFSWSNWGFGIESLKDTAERLNKFGIKYIELHGNLYGADLGYRPKEVKKIFYNF